MRRLLNLLLLLAVLVLPLSVRAAQVVAPGGRETSVGEEQAALEQGLELYRTGQFDAAVPLLEEFLNRNPADPDAPRATLALAQMLLQAGNPQQALFYLQRIAEPQRTPELQLVQGQALVATGDAESGRRELLAIDPKPLSIRIARPGCWAWPMPTPLSGALWKP